jgi:hypothetical protein
MRRKKSWPLILGMTMLMSWGTLTVQASAQSHAPDQQPMIQIKVVQHNYVMNLRQTPEEHRKLLALLDINEQTYQREIRHGRSLADIAKHQDVAEKKVIKLIAKQMKSHIDLDKREHRITAAQASYMKEHAKEYAEVLVNRKPERMNAPIGHQWFNPSYT